MKKPYMKKIGDFSGYKCWYVNGYWIRKCLEENFVNFGSSHNFPFIPKNEFWIDFENSKKEEKYYIINFLAIQRELKKGKKYEEAIRIANRIEKRERTKSKAIKKLERIKIKEKILQKIKIRKIFKKYTSHLNIELIKGNLVRDLYDLDFTEGGHDLVYSFIPKNTIWIDDDLYRKEIPFVLVHELHERKLMTRGWKYDSSGQKFFRKSEKKGERSAHFSAEEIETWCRKHPKNVIKIIKREIHDNEKEIAKSLK